MSAENRLDEIFEAIGYGPWPNDESLGMALRRAARIPEGGLHNASVSGVKQTMIDFGLLRRGEGGSWVKGERPRILSKEERAERERSHVVGWPSLPKPKVIAIPYGQLDAQLVAAVEEILRHHELM